jgi:hypothetical protein
MKFALHLDLQVQIIRYCIEAAGGICVLEAASVNSAVMSRSCGRIGGALPSSPDVKRARRIAADDDRTRTDYGNN